MNAWHIAAFRGNVEAMREIWELAKERLTTEEIKNEIILRTECEGRNAWHIAAYWGNVDAIREIWELAEERLTTEDKKIK